MSVGPLHSSWGRLQGAGLTLTAQQDILENESITLDWMFRYSLTNDIVKVGPGWSSHMAQRLTNSTGIQDMGSIPALAQ